MSGIFSKPSVPKVEAPPPPPTVDEARAAAETRDEMLRRRGRRSTILTGEGGTSPSRFKHIIKTKKGYRRLTPIELERLNGFPDNWTLLGSDQKKVSDTKRAFFMGNALVVGLIEKVGKVLAADIKKNS